MKKLGALFLIFIILFSSCSTINQSSDANNATNPPVEAEEYQDGEFPLWAYDLRRFEVIYLGAMPLVYMLTNLAYDSLAGLLDDSDVTEDYSGGKHLDNKLMITFSLSGVISITDYILGRVEKKRESND